MKFNWEQKEFIYRKILRVIREFQLDLDAAKAKKFSLALWSILFPENEL